MVRWWHRTRRKMRDIEQKLVKAVKGRGGLALKLTCPGYTGMPDRMVLFPGGRLCFVEVKALGKVPRQLAQSWAQQCITRYWVVAIYFMVAKK